MLDKDLIEKANDCTMFEFGNICQREFKYFVDKFDTLFGDKEKFNEKQIEYLQERKEGYAKLLKDSYEEQMRIKISCPSWVVTGRANYNFRKSDKAVARYEKSRKELNCNEKKFVENTKKGLEDLIPIEEQLDKIRKTGKCGVIMADDIYAIQKLEAKLEYHENKQKIMKEANAYRRKHKTLEGYPHLDLETIKELSPYEKPFEAWSLTNNNNIIKKTKERLEELKNRKEEESDYIEKDWGQLIINRDISRVQFEFNAKPNQKVIEIMKSNAFKWSPSNKAWQRILTDNAIKVANNILNKNLIEEVWEE